MTPQEIDAFKKQVADFKAWKESIERQQLRFPIDIKSLDILNKDVLVVTGEEVVPVGLLSADTAIEIDVNGTKYWLLAAPTP